MNEPSPASSAGRSWLFTLFESHFDPATIFFPEAYIHWRLPQRSQISSGDIVYVVAFFRRVFVGWGLVREAPGHVAPPEEPKDIAIQMFGLSLQEIDISDFLRRLSLSQEKLRTLRKFELSDSQIQNLNGLAEQFDTPLPNLHPEVIKFRAELAERAQRLGADWDREGQRAPEIGPMAAIEGKWAQIRDLIALKLPSGESYFSEWVSAVLVAATGIAERSSQEEYRIVDASELLRGILARARLGRPTQVPASAPWEILDWLLAKLKGAEKSIPDVPVDGASASLAVASPSVTSILADAARIAQITHHSRVQVDIRHLVVAHLLSTDGRGALAKLDLVVGEPHSFFVEMGDVLRAHLSRTASEFGDDPQKWYTFLARFDDLNLSTPEDKAAITVQHTAYAADRPGRLADDALDVASDARALAELICLQEAQPPLAIGLFGDWGSGKSTFMEMLSEAIDEVTARAALEPTLPFVDRVAHIRFNAWHYMDANLWASLVTHIFKELDRQSRDKDNDRDWLRHEQFEWLMKKLGVVQAAEREARSKLDQLNNQIELTKRQLTKIDNERAEAKKKLINASLRESLDKQEFGGPNTPIGKAAEAIGLGSGPFTGRQLRDLVSEPGSLLAQVRLLAKAVGMGKYRCHWPLWLLLALIVAPIAAAIVVAIEFPWLQQLATSIGGVLGPIAGVATWAVSFGIHLKKKLGPLLSQQQDLIREYEKKDAEQVKQEAAAKAELEDLHARQQEKERELQDKTQERERLEVIARGERPEELLERFIQTRAQAEDYRKHLGLLNSIRNDFDLMSQMMRSQREKRREGRIPIPILPSIDRIVLYIDDLDRCQDKQVVQVLEAVHLLLAFDLFVVVVGVDARWLHHSLRKIYPDQLGHGGADHASPADYLEKIFQVPFWLRPLDHGEQGSFGRLIDKLIGLDVEVTTPPLVDTPATPGDASLQGAGDGSPSSHSIEGDADEVTTVIAPVTVTLEEETPGETLQRVKLRDTEVALMRTLGPLVGKSPRATKRFVNLYRLIRARKRGAALEAFLNGTDDIAAQYPAVMLVLAIETGLPPHEAMAAGRHIRAVDENGSIAFPFLDAENDPGRKITAAISAIEQLTGATLTREPVVEALDDVARYSFSRPTL